MASERQIRLVSWNPGKEIQVLRVEVAESVQVKPEALSQQIKHSYSSEESLHGPKRSRPHDSAS